MKIYILGSNSFMEKMVDTTDKLIESGIDAFIHEDYVKMVKGGMKKHLFSNEEIQNGESVRVKIENNYLKQHYDHILISDAILVVNGEKNGVPNYIGGNVLIEMGQAYVNDKKIFLLNGLPEGLSYIDEIKAMQPICLNGDLPSINKY